MFTYAFSGMVKSAKKMAANSALIEEGQFLTCANENSDSSYFIIKTAPIEASESTPSKFLYLALKFNYGLLPSLKV